MNERAYRLNTNKTKFYALARSFFPDIEKMRKTEFIKYPRSRSYALNFNSVFFGHHLYLSVCGGAPLLVDEWKIYDPDGKETTGREVHRLTIEDLRKFEIVEEAEL